MLGMKTHCPKSNPNFLDITRKEEKNEILHEIFRIALKRDGNEFVRAQQDSVQDYNIFPVSRIYSVISNWRIY